MCIGPMLLVIAFSVYITCELLNRPNVCIIFVLKINYSYARKIRN